jgi:hypothetical protein
MLHVIKKGGSPGILDIRDVQVSTRDPLFLLERKRKGAQFVRGRISTGRSREVRLSVSRTRSSPGGIVANLKLKMQPGLRRLPNLLLEIEIAGVSQTVRSVTVAFLKCLGGHSVAVVSNLPKSSGQR